MMMDFDQAIAEVEREDVIALAKAYHDRLIMKFQSQYWNGEISSRELDRLVKTAYTILADGLERLAKEA